MLERDVGSSFFLTNILTLLSENLFEDFFGFFVEGLCFSLRPLRSPHFHGRYLVRSGVIG